MTLKDFVNKFVIFGLEFKYQILNLSTVNFMWRVWLVFAVIALLFGCRQHEGTNDNESSVPDSSEYIMRALAGFDSTFLGSLPFQNRENADTSLRTALSASIEFIPEEEFIRLSSIYQRNFSAEAEKTGYWDLWQGELAIREGEFEKAKKHFSTACEKMLSIGDSATTGHALNWLGATETYLGNVVEANESHVKALSIYEALKDSAGIFATMREIASVNYRQNNFSKAKEYLNKCLEYYKRQPSKISLASTYLSMGEMFQIQGDLSQFRYYNLLALKVFEDEQYGEGIAQTYNNMAVSEMTAGNFEGAKTWLLKSKALTDSTGDSLQTPIQLYNIGACEIETGNLAEGKKLLIQSLAINAARKMQGEITIRSYARLASASELSGDYKAATEYLKAKQSVADSLYNLENKKAIEEIQIKYETQKKENELQALKLAEKQKEIWIWVLSTGLISLVLLSILIGMLLYNRSKRREEKHKLEEELQNAELARVQQELEFHKQQLNDYVETLREKTQQIKSLEEDLSSQILSEVSAETVEAEKESSDRIDSLFGFKILTEEDWLRFKKYFDNVYPGLIQKLRVSFPETTAAEQRLFMLIRLNSDSREIAEMLGISMDSVRKTKYRLKKKLGLKEEEILDDFVKRF